VRLRLPAALAAAHAEAGRRWRERGDTRRLLSGEADLWSGADEARWLGWLDAPAVFAADLPLWSELAADARQGRFRHVLLLGMGGSSLAPEVQRAVLGAFPGQPALHVLDSIHPDQMAAVERALDPAATLVVVASKSGSTLEPGVLMAHWLARVGAAVGEATAPRRFVAITDPGSKLEAFARERGFRHIVAGDPAIGGRYSALSPFGLAPLALQGAPVADWLARAATMAAACRTDDPAHNPGAALGLLLGAAALAGRDKVTFVVHPDLEPTGAWLEQLVAESTGKRGRAVLPFDGEPLGPPEVYGEDRLFVALTAAGELGAGDAAKLDTLAGAGQPVVELDVAAAIDLGAEMYRWEFATAVAGATIGVNPFDQPDVEAAKVEARRLTAEIERTGALPEERPFFSGDGVSLLAPEAQARVLLAGAGSRPTLAAILRAHLARAGRGDYFAALLFCAMGGRERAAAQRLRVAVRDGRRVATSVGFGPRYLHSTGQAHKGGPASGVFLVVTDEPSEDFAIPGQRLTFGQAIAAQARGDAEVLAARGRRLLRVHLHGPGGELLEDLAEAIAQAAV
jgi:transaldolase/glucose-6-phosphate isomerase